MLGESPEDGLTARDFHPQPSFIDPRDVFPSRSRQSSRLRSPLLKRGQHVQPSLGNSLHHGCCTPEEKKPSCVNINDDSGPSSPRSCGGDCDQCEDCIEDHGLCADEDDCLKDCDECLDEHEQACGQKGKACVDVETCDDCDFSCFECIDWSQFENDKALGLSYSVPLLGQDNQFNIDLDLESPLDNGLLNNAISPQDSMASWSDVPVAPVDVSMHHQCMDNYWTAMLQPQVCPDPNFPQLHGPMPGWSPQVPQFGCHPATMHSQQQLPAFTPQQLIAPPMASSSAPTPKAETSPTTISCQWLMPCGTTCSAIFASITDLKKHLKSTHCPKGTTTCAWNTCTATFGSEAALTGHISKKHLSNIAPTSDSSDGPFKCTFPGCTKSFMYKQVLLSHLASHSGENKAYCHICEQWLNAEGSNFRRHMQSHRPKHEHLVCKWHHLGCKRRFPRLDNLRRHEGACKFGKKARLHHHHAHVHKAEGH